MPLISALAIRPWCQHFDGELRLRQNHRKTKKSGFCMVSILCQNFDVSRVEKLIAWIGKVSPCCRLYLCALPSTVRILSTKKYTTDVLEQFEARRACMYI